MYNFARFVQWPGDAAGEMFDMCVAGADPFMGALDEIVAGERINERLVRRRSVTTAAEAVDCRILFVSRELAHKVAEIGAKHYAIFSCDTARLAGALAGKVGGIWWMRADGPTGPFDIGGAKLLAAQDLYAGRLIADRAGQWHLMAFDNTTANGNFMGSIVDPIPVVVDKLTGDLSLAPGRIV